jgi:murein DD-endopeptidase MepM/ murein hydrolase activator NlpD
MTPLCETGKTGKIIFRLTAVLYLILLLKPGQYFNHQKPLAGEHGIGGGYTSEELISEEEPAVLMTPVSLESTLEPGSISKSHALFCDSYMVKRGDNISTLAINFGLNQDTIISVNRITNSRLLQAEKMIKIPNQDGVFHSVKSGENLTAIAQKYNADSEAIKIVNELFSDKVVTGTELFIPGARLDWARLQEINGDLFVWPVSGNVTSSYGWRRNPFNRSLRHFHNGIDIKGSTGTPIRAAMSGRVSAVGYDNIFGNYVVINHHSGYRTLYGHMSVIRTKTGAYVAQGERIGDIGSTGQSTGPHLHFTVYKNGATTNPRALLR